MESTDSILVSYHYYRKELIRLFPKYVQTVVMVALVVVGIGVIILAVV